MNKNTSEKFLTEAELPKVIAKYQNQGQSIVFTNGCFDILHAGHVRYLAAARALGQVLIVGINTDESVRRLKGDSRPVNPLADRMEVLAALTAVSHVVFFADATAERLVQLIRPDIYVKGGDYQVEELPEAKLVAAYGGRTVLIPELQGRSTSNMIAKMKSQTR